MSDRTKNCEHTFEYEESGLFNPKQASANTRPVANTTQTRTQTRFCKKCGKQETRKQKVVWDEWQPLPDMMIDE